MTIIRLASAAAIALVSWAALLATPAAAQDGLARVKDLYASAAYEEALVILNELDRGSPGEAAEGDLYRAFCLLALGRSDDAGAVIEQIVRANPTFRPSEMQASPRLQDAFTEVRQRVLPSIVRQAYAQAKAAYERKELDAAARQFDRVVALLDDPALASGELADLRILSSGFLDLVKTASAPPQPVAAPAPPPAPAPAPEAPPPSIYGPDDAAVAPPVAVSQRLPPWHPAKPQQQAYDGRLVLDIDERGDVIAVISQGGLDAGYAALLRRAAASWKYRPATKNGVPVRYRKLVGVHLDPPAPERPAREQG